MLTSALRPLPIFLRGQVRGQVKGHVSLRSPIMNDGCSMIIDDERIAQALRLCQGVPTEFLVELHDGGVGSILSTLTAPGSPLAQRWLAYQRERQHLGRPTPS